MYTNLSPLQIAEIFSAAILIIGLVVYFLLWMSAKRPVVFTHNGTQITMREQEKKLWDQMTTKQKNKAFKELKKLYHRNKI